jgi:CBS-domain-containing membrane protein
VITGVTVGEVMRRQVVAVRERARFTEIVQAMRRFHLSSMPVIDSQDHVIGLISNYDLLLCDEPRDLHRGGRLDRLFRRDGVYGGACKIATELMTSPAVTVTASTPAREAARVMYRHRIHQLPVVEDTSGRLTGIVTRADLLAVYERPDEDIRREILHDIIEHTLGISPGRLKVTAVGGTVTLSGRLECRSHALRLAEAVLHVAGVITVIDHLTYETDDTVAKAPPRV